MLTTTNKDFIEEELISSLKDDDLDIFEDMINRARNGDANEIYNIGYKYDEKKDHVKALKWFQKAALKNHKLGLYKIGTMYEHGDGVDIDYKLAKEWYLKATKHGSNSAAASIGNMYFYGKGVVVDYTLALEWYIKSVNNGDNYMAHTIGRMYHEGLGVAVDYKLAMEWYLKATKSRWKQKAATNIGILYHEGLGMDVDYQQAMEWFQKADDGGDIDAPSHIGWMYHNGYGVPIDYQLAMEWYQKAIEKENRTVYTRVGLLYKQGLGVPKDLHYAFECLQKGVHGSFPTNEGLHELAYFYESEEAFKDKELAMQWYTKASDRGYEKANEALIRLKQEKEEERRINEIRYIFSNKPFTEIVSNITESGSLLGNSETVPRQNIQRIMTVLSEKFKALEARISEVEKESSEKDTVIIELTKMLARRSIEIEGLQQNLQENNNNNHSNNSLNNPNANTNINIIDTSNDINYDSPHASDQEDSANDINYDTEFYSDSNSDSSSSNENDVNYDSDDA